MEAVDNNCIFPPGYRFQPTQVELIENHLKLKVYYGRHPKIPEHNIYEIPPPDQPDEERRREVELGTYFFTEMKNKKENGNRLNRIVEGRGYWRATGREGIKNLEGGTIGYKRTLVYYKGRAKDQKKTNWIMHEFTLLDCNKWALCKIHYNKDRSRKRRDAVRPQADSSLPYPFSNPPSPPLPNLEVLEPQNTLPDAASTTPPLTSDESKLNDKGLGSQPLLTSTNGWDRHFIYQQPSPSPYTIGVELLEGPQVGNSQRPMHTDQHMQSQVSAEVEPYEPLWETTLSMEDLAILNGLGFP